MSVRPSPQVLCTKGKLTAPEITSLELDELTLKVTWNTGSNKYSYSSDSVKTLIYYPKTGEYSGISNNFIRGDGELTYQFSDRHIGNVAHIYMYFVSLGFEKNKWSDSVYVGGLEIE